MPDGVREKVLGSRCHICRGGGQGRNALVCDGDSYFPQVANLFGADSKEISIVEFNHNNDKMVHTLQFESGLIVLINRLGSQSLPVGLDHMKKAY